MRVRTKIFCWFYLGAGILGTSAPASSDPFGSNGLPYFADHAEMIVQSSSCKLSQRTQFVRVAEVKIERTLRGSAAAKTVNVLIRGAGASQDAPDKAFDDLAQLQSATLFLSGPIPAEQLAVYEVKEPGVVIRGLVSDTAAIPLADTTQQQAIDDYLRSDTKESRLAWARTNLKSSNPVVQRWALLETGEHILKGSIEPADQLSEIAKGKLKVELQPMLLAQLMSLRQTAEFLDDDKLKGTASDGLLHILGDTSASLELQYRAFQVFPIQERAAVFKRWQTANPERAEKQPVFSWISELDKLSDKDKGKLLLSWEAGDDKLQQKWAKALRAGIARAPVNVSPEQLEKLQTQFLSQNTLEKAHALGDFRSLGASKATIDLAKNTLFDGKCSEYVRSRVIDAIAEWRSEDAIALLASVAVAASQPAALRSSAILAIGRSAGTGFEPAKRTLAELAASLDDKELKALARSLQARP